MPKRAQRVLSPEFAYDPRAARYRNRATGRFESWQNVRSALDQVLRAGSQRTATLSQSLIDGKITLADWARGMQQEIKINHLLGHVLAVGGWERMTPAEFGRAGAEIRAQYAYLRRFTEQIASGSVQLDGRIVHRAMLYVQSARRTHNENERQAAVQAGYDEERRLLGQAEHCDDCVEYAGRGWQPIGRLPVIGDSVCRANCHCHFEYRKSSR